MLLRRAALLALVLGAATAVGCAPPPLEAGEDEAEALRQIQAQDVNEVLVENVPVRTKPGAGVAPVMARVASWTLRHVEYRDAANPDKADPIEPFKGYFLIANDANGDALFLDAISVLDGKAGLEGTLHSYFTFATRTGDSGALEYEEVPLTGGDDEASKAQATATHAWLKQQRAAVAQALPKASADLGGQSLRPAALDKLQASKCAIDIALLVLTATNPIAGFLVQAGVDGAFAIIQTAIGQDGKELAMDAAVGAALAGVAQGALTAVTRSVAASLIVGAVKGAVVREGKATAHAAQQVIMAGGVRGAAVAGGTAVGGGYLGVQLVDLLIPRSCQKAYASIKTD